MLLRFKMAERLILARYFWYVANSAFDNIRMCVEKATIASDHKSVNKINHVLIWRRNCGSDYEIGCNARTIRNADPQFCRISVFQ